MGSVESWQGARAGIGTFAALTYRDGEVDLFLPSDARTLRGALGDAQGTAVVFSTRGRAGRGHSGAVSADDLWPRAGRYAVRADARRSWTELLARLETELQVPAPGSRAAAQALLRLLIVDAVRLARTSPSTPPRQMLVDVAAVIDARFRTSLSLAEVASTLSVSPSHLGRLVRQQTGRSVGEWIRARRMEEARRRLRATDAPIEAIAAEIGYRDVTHFRRHFFRAHDTTPARWRERARPDLGTRVR